MPTFDYVCYVCDWHREDCYVPRWDSPVLCANGHEAEKLYSGKSAHVIPDTFTTPVVDDVIAKERKVFHSRSERRAEMRRQGLQEGIRHVGEAGSDKSRHTSRWL